MKKMKKLILAVIVITLASCTKEKALLEVKKENVIYKFQIEMEDGSIEETSIFRI